MIGMCDIQPNQKVLDPCAGPTQVFVKNFPTNTNRSYAEIDHEPSINFLELDQPYDWIIGNPPYSKWDVWVDKTCELTDNFCYIMSFLNFTHKRLDRIQRAGFGLTKMHVLKVDYWFSPSIVVVFQRNQPSIISVTPETIKCECGIRCGRGRADQSMNMCCKKKKRFNLKSEFIHNIITTHTVNFK
eukprot:Lithocolla_globosa_v1_NODE_58_length_7390_cov_243.140014.p3 type:complete len:186 gc:universal NODE_58_length_7390_cov_243.140014:1935-1378(-)